MEQRNHKKGVLIAFITLIVLMFICGAIFTIVKDNYDKETQKYDNHQSQIEEYDKTIED